MTEDPTQDEIPELDAHLAEEFEALEEPEKNLLRIVGWAMGNCPNDLTFELDLHCKEHRCALRNLYSASVDFHSSDGGFHQVRWIESHCPTLTGNVLVTFNSEVRPFLRQRGEEAKDGPDPMSAANDSYQ